MQTFAIISPPNTITGGVEALHQLCDKLSAVPNVLAYMYYPGGKGTAWKHYGAIYNTRVTDAIPRTAHIVVPDWADTATYRPQTIGRIFVWWLACSVAFSCDRYTGCSHLFQSEYARAVLTAAGISGQFLTDYIRRDETSHPQGRAKKNLIAYNGSKSALEAALLKILDPSLPLVPIRNLSAPQVVQLLDECKIYLDLGAHPGRDRLPREAALSECIILTNRRGSAAFHADVPIDDAYKVDDLRLERIPGLLHQLLKNYHRHTTDFDPYRHWILSQERQFENEVLALVSVASTVPTAANTSQFTKQGLDDLRLAALRELGDLRAKSAKLAIDTEAITVRPPLKWLAIQNATRVARKLSAFRTRRR